MIFNSFSSRNSSGFKSVLILSAFLTTVMFFSPIVSAGILPGDFSGNVYGPSGETLEDVNVTIRGYTEDMFPNQNESEVLTWNESDSDGWFNITEIPTKIDEDNITRYVIDMKKWDGDVLEYMSESYMTLMDPFFFEQLGTYDYKLSEAVMFNVSSNDGTKFSYEVKDYLSEEVLVTNHHDTEEENGEGYVDNFSFYGVADREFMFNFGKEESPLHLNKHIDDVTGHEDWNETTRELNLTINLEIGPRRVSGYVNTSDGSSQFTNLSVVY